MKRAYIHSKLRSLGEDDIPVRGLTIKFIYYYSAHEKNNYFLRRRRWCSGYIHGECAACFYKRNEKKKKKLHSYLLLSVLLGTELKLINTGTVAEISRESRTYKSCAWVSYRNHFWNEINFLYIYIRSCIAWKLFYLCTPCLLSLVEQGFFSKVGDAIIENVKEQLYLQPPLTG